MFYKKIFFFGFLSFYFFSYSQTHDAKIIDKVYGKTGAHVSDLSLIIIKKLFELIAITDTYQQMSASQKTAAWLKTKIEDEEKSVNNDSYNNDLQIYRLKILTLQKEHFERMARLYLQNMSQPKKIYGWIKEQAAFLWCSIVSLFRKKIPIITQLKSALISYTEIELEEICIDHEAILLLLVGQNIHPIPLLIRFWDFPPHRHILLNGAKKYHTGARAQSELIDIAGDAAGDASGLASGLVEGTTAEVEEATAALEKTETSFMESLNPTITDTADLSPAEEAQSLASFEEETMPLWQSITKWTDGTVRNIRKLDPAAKDMVTPADSFSTSVNAITTNEADLAAEQEAALQELAAAQKAAEDASKSKFVRSLNAFSQKVNSTINPLERACQTAEKMEQGVFKITAILQKTYNTIFLKTGMGQLKDFFSNSAVGTYFKENAVVKFLGKGLNYISKPTKYVFNLAKKCTFTNVFRAMMARTSGKMMISMIEQTEISMGSQMVASWQSAADALVFNALSQQRTTLSQQLNTFFTQLNTYQQSQMTALSNKFSASTALIAANFSTSTDPSSGKTVIQGLLPTLLSVEQTFISQQFLNAMQKSVFLTNPMQDDQLFAYAACFAKNQNSMNPITPWYNIFRVGNWEFSSVDYSLMQKNPITSFVQYTTVPCTSTTYPKGDPTLIEQNSIFAEYIPAASYLADGTESYTIKIDFTLLAEPETPFVLGVMFNKARWISGVTDFHNQYRFLCIYTTQNQPKNTMNVGFSETFYQTATDMADDQLADTTSITQNPVGSVQQNAQSPLFQIFSTNQMALETMAQNNNAAFIANPLAQIPALTVGNRYRFLITTQSNKVFLSIFTMKTGAMIFPMQSTPSPATSESSTASAVTEMPYEIDLLSPLTFLYHNIGFVAAGCSAQYIVVEPLDLTYTPEQIASVQNSLPTGGKS